MAGEIPQTAPGTLAPDAAAEAGTPQEQPVSATTAPAAPSKGPGPTVDVRALQAGYTQVSQQNAAVKRALGLPREATQQQVLEALDARSRAATSEAAPYYETPELAARAAELDERERDLAERMYGQELAGQAWSIVDLARQGASPMEVAAAFHAAVLAASGQAAPAAPGAPAPAAPQVSASAPEDEIDMEAPHGGYGLRQPDPNAVADLRGTGKLGDYIRRVLTPAR